MMKNAPNFVTFCSCTGIGIDVSKATLEVVGIAGAEVWRAEIANSELEIEQVAQALQAGGYRGKVICEATGHYHLLLGLVFARHALDLRIINPLQSSKHRQARVRKTKTDRVDGYVLATMCATERELPAAAQLQPERVLARLKQGQLQALDKQLQQMSRSASAYDETYAKLGLAPGASAAALARVVAELKAARRQLQKELEGLLVQAADVKDLDRLRKIPGFSRLVSGLVSTGFNREAPSERSWVAYSGLDVSIRQSGVWRGRGKLTKRGNSFLRKRLYCAAWGAVMNYAEVRAYYDRLKAAGRKHVEALCIIARKLLRIAYTILVRGKEYDATIAFAS